MNGPALGIAKGVLLHLAVVLQQRHLQHLPGVARAQHELGRFNPRDAPLLIECIPAVVLNDLAAFVLRETLDVENLAAVAGDDHEPAGFDFLESELLVGGDGIAGIDIGCDDRRKVILRAVFDAESKVDPADHADDDERTAIL